MKQLELSSTMPNMPKLYLLTNDDDFELLYQKLEIALSTGLIALLQIRRKQVLSMLNGALELFKEAQQIIKLAKIHNVPVVINDDMELAEKLGVGVHLGQTDGSIDTALQSLSPHQIIGRTCHGDIELVKEAKNDGASYAAMGAVFTSTTKPNANIISRQQLLEGCQQGMPICVIGGLTAENISELRDLPIALVAVVGDIMDLPIADIAQRCFEWQQAFSEWKTPT